MTEPTGSASPETCARCGRTLTPGDRVEAGGKLFCASCYETLRAVVENAAAAMTRDIPYGKALVGALLGGAAGTLLWWGFTAATKISFGLVAVAIGFLVGQGAVRFAGHKRSHGLQWMAIVVTLASFAVATYLVNMTFANVALAAAGDPRRLGFPPASFETFVRVLTAGFRWMDLVFLAIALYEAWKIPRPPRIVAGGA